MPILVNQKTIETFLFSGGECHVKLGSISIGDRTEIHADLFSSDDTMSLFMIVDAVRQINPATKITLTIPYFPYARQDRVCNEGESLSVKVMAGLINQLACAQVVVYDPHSDVTPALIDRCKVVSMSEIVSKSSLANFIKINNLSLVFPDAGAEKKTRNLGKQLNSIGVPVEVVGASKVRETATGKITATEIHGEVKGKNLLVVDDICDGGQTFISLAQVLKEKGAGDVYLYVTHGIFSKGVQVLADHFKKVFCFHTLMKTKEQTKGFLEILGGQS